MGLCSAFLNFIGGYDPLQYPLLFSYGTDGWHINLKLANGRKLTAMVYYRYHIMVRQQVPVLLKAKRLFQQFLVDAYCKIETERLQFLRREQKALRADCYQDLRDAMVDGDGDPRNVGGRVILPSSFTSACYCVVTSGRFYLSFKVALEVTLLMLASSDLICGTVWWLNNYTLT